MWMPRRNPWKSSVEAVERLEIQVPVEKPGDPRQVVVQDEPASRFEPLAPERVAVIGQPLGTKLLELIAANKERHGVHQEVADSHLQVVDSLLVDETRDERPIDHVEVQIRESAGAMKFRDRVAFRCEARELGIQPWNGGRGRDHLDVETAVYRCFAARARIHKQHRGRCFPRGEEPGDLLGRPLVRHSRVCVREHHAGVCRTSVEPGERACCHLVVKGAGRVVPGRARGGCRQEGGSPQRVPAAPDRPQGVTRWGGSSGGRPRTRRVEYPRRRADREPPAYR